MFLEKTNFFMRFYNQTDENIQKVVDYVFEHYPRAKYLGIFPAEMTATLGGIVYLHARAVQEIHFEFATREEYQIALNDIHMQKFYAQYACSEYPNAEVILRKDGDESFTDPFKKTE